MRSTTSTSQHQLRRAYLLGLVIPPLVAWGQPASAEPALTLEQAVEQALARAPELRAMVQKRRAAEERVQQARSAYLPRLEVGASYLAWWPKNELPIELPDLPTIPQIGEIDDYHHVRAGLSANVRLFDLARGPRVAAAQQGAIAATASIQEGAVALAHQVRATFLAALFARDVQRIANESLEIARAQERQARVRAEVGTGSQVALAQARVRVAELQAQLGQAQSELSRYREQLASILGVPLAALPSLQGDLESLAEPRKGQAVGENPALQRLAALRRAAAQSARSAARSFAPTLDLFAKGEVEYPHRMKVEWGPLLQGGVQLSWPFFEGGLRWHQKHEAEAQGDRLSALQQATRERLSRQVIDLEARARTAGADLASAKETLAQNEVYLRVAKAAVSAGTGTDLDVHQAELGVDHARIAVRRALLALALVRAEMLKVRGVAQEQPRAGGQS